MHFLLCLMIRCLHERPKTLKRRLLDVLSSRYLALFWVTLTNLTEIYRCPAALAQHVHRAKVYVPIDVARALATNPALIQRATEAFYTRDALQLRVSFNHPDTRYTATKSLTQAAQRMSRFPPKPDVLTSVSMTRPAYAQLVGQVFHPPKVFGVWQEKEGTPERRWKDVGMKIVSQPTGRNQIKRL